MKKVRIIKGVYGYRPAPGKSTQPIYMGKTVDLPDAEADRLVDLKVAEYVTKAAPETDIPPVVTPPAAPGGDGAGADTPPDENGAEGQKTGQEDNGGDDGRDGPVLDIEDGRFTKETLLEMTRENMEKLAADLGIDAKTIKDCKNKDALADAIMTVEVADEGDGEQPPDLQPEAPVP